MQLRDQIWTTSFGDQIEVRTVDGDLVAVVKDTVIAKYIAEIHNAQLDQIENSGPFDFEEFVKELREDA